MEAKKYLSNEKFVFFVKEGEKGLTSTSANQVADKAKEYVKHIKEELDGISLYDNYISLLVSPDAERLTASGWTPDQLSLVYDKLKRVASANALIAWLREAVKAKEALTKEAKSITVYQWLDKEGIEAPKQPASKSYTDADYLDTLSVSERNRFFTLDAFCSTVGKYIHPGGAFHVARKELMNVLANPIVTQMNGKDTIINRREGTMSATEADSLHFTLAAALREKQAEYNKMKADQENWVTEHNLEEQKNYNLAWKEFEVKRQEQAKQYEVEMKELQMEIKKLKIVIPEALQNMYKEINDL